MSVDIRLLGSPTVEVDGTVRSFRSRKSWALLTCLLLNERPQPRSRLTSLLFAAADDPLRALRWSLAEIRRVLGEAVALEGNPLTLGLDQAAIVDVDVVLHGSWREAIALSGLTGELLEGLAFDGCPAFEAWLLSERRRIASASEGILHEAALALLALGEFDRAVSSAASAVGMNPFDEDHQALLVRAYVLAGDRASAELQANRYAGLVDRELGAVPGPAIASALRAGRGVPGPVDVGPVSTRAVLEAGVAAVDAGATETGVDSLRHAVAMAEAIEQAPLLVDAKVALAEALIHSLRGEDEEGTALLHSAIAVAESAGMALAAGRAMSMVGYVEFLRARYDRAEQWLERARSAGSSDPDLHARVYAYLGSVESDRGNYPRALGFLGEAVKMSSAPRHARWRAHALAMRGRAELLRGDYASARLSLCESIDAARSDRWLAFLPWPQSFLGELEVVEGELDAARNTLRHAFATACQLGDPCWEGVSARGLALLADAEGDSDRAFEILLDARTRCSRFSDTYVWLDVYILDALANLGLREGHPAGGEWAHAMSERAERTGMREFGVRAMVHRYHLGENELALTAAWQGSEIDNPRLAALLAAIG